MSETYRVDPAALTDHARVLSGLAEELGGALDAAGGVSLGGDAYGQTCRGFAASLDQVAKIGQDTLHAGIEALRTEAANLREAVTEYEQQESRGVTRLNRTGTEPR